MQRVCSESDEAMARQSVSGKSKLNKSTSCEIPHTQDVPGSKHKLSLAPSASPRQQVTTKDISIDTNSPSLSSMENLMSHTLKHPPKPSNGSATSDSVQCSKTSGTSVQDLPSLHCSACNKRYKTKAGLYKHQRSKHLPMMNPSRPILCKEGNCDFRCKRLVELRKHLKCHGLEINTFVKNFSIINGEILPK